MYTQSHIVIERGPSITSNNPSECLDGPFRELWDRIADFPMGHTLGDAVVPRLPSQLYRTAFGARLDWKPPL